MATTVSIHNVKTHEEAWGTGETWQDAARLALRELGDRDGIATCEKIGTGCFRIQTGRFIRKVNATSLGYVYTVSILEENDDA